MDELGVDDKIETNWAQYTKRKLKLPLYEDTRTVHRNAI